MLQPDIRDLLFDPDVGGGQPFQIERISYGRYKGRQDATTKAVEVIDAVGSVQPANEDALQQLPEGERGTEAIIVRSTTPILDGRREKDKDIMPDVIVYNGKRYKVSRTMDWSGWGMYKAICVRQNEVVA